VSDMGYVRESARPLSRNPHLTWTPRRWALDHSAGAAAGEPERGPNEMNGRAGAAFVADYNRQAPPAVRLARRPDHRWPDRIGVDVSEKHKVRLPSRSARVEVARARTS